MKEARARKSTHHQQQQQLTNKNPHNSKRTRTPAANGNAALNNSKGDMSKSPAYVPLNNELKEHGKKEKKHGFWSSLIRFLTCTSSSNNSS